MNWSEAFPELWYAAVFLVAHSIQFRAHELYHAVIFFGDQRRTDLAEHQQHILAKLAGTRLSVLTHLHKLSLLNRQSYAIVAGTTPFYNMNRPVSTPRDFQAGLPEFLRKPFPNPLPSSFPYILRTRHHDDIEINNVVHKTRLRTAEEASRHHLGPETYEFRLVAWRNIDWPCTTMHPANLHLPTHRVLLQCIAREPPGRQVRSRKNGFALHAEFAHTAFPMIFRRRGGRPETDSLGAFTRCLPMGINPVVEQPSIVDGGGTLPSSIIPNPDLPGGPLTTPRPQSSKICTKPGIASIGEKDDALDAASASQVIR